MLLSDGLGRSQVIEVGRVLAIDLFCGLGGWSEGLLAEGWEVVGFDIERHEYGVHRYPGQLVIQDVRTLHGSQFRAADLIVASPPCQEYSYMAMPWKLAKAKGAAIRADTTGKELARLNELFNACFRIQFEASRAAGRHIPMVVENVRGAQPWVGRARWNFGSFYLWGDVPALMPMTISAYKVGGTNISQVGFNEGIKHQESGHAWFRTGHGQLPSSSPSRKMASAMIAKIPLPLARHIGAVFRDA